MAGVACRHYTVEHIDTHSYIFQDVGGCAHAHQVARLVLGQNTAANLGHLVHQLGRFAHRHAADGVSFTIHRGDKLGRLHA